jgi:hypothetical protein
LDRFAPEKIKNICHGRIMDPMDPHVGCGSILETIDNQAAQAWDVSVVDYSSSLGIGMLGKAG